MIIGIDASKTTSREKTGIDNTAFEIILNLKKIDKKNTYYLYTNKPLDKVLTDSPRFREKLIPFPRLWNKFRLPLALLKDKPDIFLALTNTIPSLAPEKSAVLIHDLAFKFFPGAYSKTELFLQESAMSQSVKKAERIIVTSQANKKDLLKFYSYPKNKIEVAPLGYDKELLENKKRSDINGKPYFLFVGRLEERKNVARLVEAFVEFKKKYKTSHNLILAGKPGYGYDKIKNKIDSAKEYKKNIIELGYVSNQKLAQLYQNADALVFPSLYEGFGLPILEAFGSKIPVLSSNIETIKEVASSSALLINPTKIIEIAEGLNTISSDQRLRSDLIRKGEKTLRNYSWENTAKRILSVLEEMA